MSAPRASSTRSALCSSSRITAARAQPGPAGVGVGGGDQRPALLPGQPDGRGVVRIHPRPRHPRRRIRRRPGRGTGSTGRTTRSPTTGAGRCASPAPACCWARTHRSTCTRPAPRTSRPRSASQACQPSRSPAYERRVRAERRLANHAAASSRSRSSSAARAGSSASDVRDELAGHPRRPRSRPGGDGRGQAAASARSVMDRDGSEGHRQPGDIAGYHQVTEASCIECDNPHLPGRTR